MTFIIRLFTGNALSKVKMKTLVTSRRWQTQEIPYPICSMKDNAEREKMGVKMLKNEATL